MRNDSDASAHDLPRDVPAPVRPVRLIKKPTLQQRQSWRFTYHTFPTAPPRNFDRRTSSRGGMKRNGSNAGSVQTRSQSRGSHHETPLPKKQLAILAVIALAEQTALNSISPYLPEMVGTFPEVADGQAGLYVGLIASSFALAQFATGFAWGLLSDRIGRKPIVLIGTLATAAALAAFGFCKTLWQAVLVQTIMGLVNGNQGVISTCLGEITDRSNQSKAFTYLPVIYGLGGITGPILGSLLVMRKDPFSGEPAKYPYLWPNLLSAALLVVDFILTAIFLEESLQNAKDLPAFGRRFTSLFSWIWQFTSSGNPTYARRTRKDSDAARQTLISRNSAGSLNQVDEEEEDIDSESFFSKKKEVVNYREIFTRNTILLMVTFLIFQLSNVSFNNLYPVFAQASPPTGRDLSIKEIGISLAFAGIITIIFQVGIFGRLREKMGNKATYRLSHAGFVVSFLLIPWVGYKNSSGVKGDSTTTVGKALLWAELGVVLIIKTIASVGGLTSSLLLITNSAPSHAILGRLNGVAQTLSAGGRAAGPFISGALFTAATHVHPKGEALAFGVFGGIAFLGALLSLGIKGDQLEDDDWEPEDDDEEEAVESHGLPTRGR